MYISTSECIPIEYIKEQIEEYRKFDHLGMYAEFLDMFIQDYKDNAMANYADRKTEPNCSEKPNNCDTCRNKGFEGCEQPCLGCGCCGLYEPKDEPQIFICPIQDNYEALIEDEPQTYVINPQEPTNDDKCFECDDFFTCGGQCNKIEDEPQTERNEYEDRR